MVHVLSDLEGAPGYENRLKHYHNYYQMEIWKHVNEEYCSFSCTLVIFMYLARLDDIVPLPALLKSCPTNLYWELPISIFYRIYRCFPLPPGFGGNGPSPGSDPRKHISITTQQKKHSHEMRNFNEQGFQKWRNDSLIYGHFLSFVNYPTHISVNVDPVNTPPPPTPIWDFF